jgi:molybdate transport system substrate-binding protein
MKKFLITIAWAVLLGAVGVKAAEINVFAAASLTDALKEIAAGYEKSSGDKVVFNFGASSTLARQIEEGAPADIFFSADEAKMNALEKKNLIVKGTRKSRLGNSLVVVVEQESKVEIRSGASLTNAEVRRIALADPKAVPAGVYAKQWLERLGLWTAVAAKIVPTENVRAALAAVESGNVDVGVVYKTDAGISKQVRVAYEVPAKEAPEISYPMALVKEAKHAESARKFLDFLGSEAAAEGFRKFGFQVRD